MAETEEVKNPNLVQVTSSAKNTNRSISFETDLGQDLDDAVAKFDADVVFSIYHAQAVIKAQAAARRILDDSEKTEEDAIAAGVAYTPGVVIRRAGAKADPVQVLAQQVREGKMSRKDLIALIDTELADK